jgi:hypothetical protein
MALGGQAAALEGAEDGVRIRLEEREIVIGPLPDRAVVGLGAVAGREARQVAKQVGELARRRWP